MRELVTDTLLHRVNGILVATSCRLILMLRVCLGWTLGNARTALAINQIVPGVYRLWVAEKIVRNLVGRRLIVRLLLLLLIWHLMILLLLAGYNITSLAPLL